MDDVSTKSDDELEKIVRLAINTHVDGSQYQRAKNELEIRRNRKIYEQQSDAIKLQERTSEHQQKVLELQEKIYNTAQTRLDKIIKILDKPWWAAFWAGAAAVIIGVSINIVTSLICKYATFLGCQLQH